MEEKNVSQLFFDFFLFFRFLLFLPFSRRLVIIVKLFFCIKTNFNFIKIGRPSKEIKHTHSLFSI